MWGARRAAGTGLACLALAAAGCLEAPPGAADACPAPDPLSVDPLEATLSETVTHLVFTRSADGWRRVYLDGRLADENLVLGDFGAWDPGQRITVGGPVTGVSAECEEGEASFWRGRIHRLAI